jgi:hypothetical protein
MYVVICQHSLKSQRIVHSDVSRDMLPQMLDDLAVWGIYYLCVTGIENGYPILLHYEDHTL